MAVSLMSEIAVHDIRYRFLDIVFNTQIKNTRFFFKTIQ